MFAFPILVLSAFEALGLAARAAFGLLVDLFAPLRLLRLAAVSSWGLSLGALASSALVALFLVATALTNPYLGTDLDRLARLESAVAVYDRDGLWLGVDPSARFAGERAPTDAVAVPLTSAPPVWKACLAYLEDRGAFDGLSARYGVDPSAIVRSAWFTLTFRRRRGASTLAMEAVRTLRGQSPSRDEPWTTIAVRKFGELFGARALVAMLSDRDPEAAARFIGTHLPLVTGVKGSAFGGDLDGLEIAAQLLFHKSAAALDPAEQAALAAAVKAPILMAPPGDAEGRRLAEKRWRRLIGRADFCLAHAPDADSPRFAAARRRLATMPLPRPRAPTGVAALLPRDHDAAWRILANPMRRAEFFGASALAAAHEQLAASENADWRGRVVAMTLSVAARDEAAYEAQIEARLAQLLPGGAAAQDAFVSLSAVDGDGEVRLFHQNRPRAFWGARQQLGSVAKLFAALTLAGRAGPQTPTCRLATAPAPCPEASRLPLAEAMARSDSAAMSWALRRYADSDDARRVADAFSLPLAPDIPFATQFTLGLIERTPAENLRDMGALSAALNAAAAPAPNFLREIIELTPDGRLSRRRPPSPLAALDVRPLVAPRRADVAALFAAPLGAHGTLGALAEERARLRGALWGKTGTVSHSGTTTAARIAGGFVLRGEPWAFDVAIFGDERPLGVDVEAAQFASLARDMLRAAERAAR